MKESAYMESLNLTSQLRDGNWVLDGDALRQVDFQCSITYTDDQFDDGYGHMDSGKLKGVPIEQILLTNHNIRFYEYDTDAFSLMYIKQGDIIAGPFPKSVPLVHLHQLQNLFFALTGTELIYTP